MQQGRRGEAEQRRAAGAEAPPLGCPRPDGAAEQEEEEEGGRYRFVLDVAGFGREELSVQLAGRRLTVRGKRGIRTEAPDGCVAHRYREVRRELLLPADADLEALACALDAHGRLCVRAPRLPAAPPAGCKEPGAPEEDAAAAAP